MRQARLAALYDLQDRDAACWHCRHFNHGDFAREEPFAGPLAKPGPGAFPYEYAFDEVEQASRCAAGAIARHGLVAPAPRPTVFTFGAPALHDMRSMDYAGAYGRTGLMDMMTTAYASGMRLVIDPAQPEFLATDGPVHRFNGFERSPRLPSRWAASSARSPTTARPRCW
jgi:hypothetical protein